MGDLFDAMCAGWLLHNVRVVCHNHFVQIARTLFKHVRKCNKHSRDAESPKIYSQIHAMQARAVDKKNYKTSGESRFSEAVSQ